MKPRLRDRAAPYGLTSARSPHSLRELIQTLDAAGKMSLKHLAPVLGGLRESFASATATTVSAAGARHVAPPAIADCMELRPFIVELMGWPCRDKREQSLQLRARIFRDAGLLGIAAKDLCLRNRAKSPLVVNHMSDIRGKIVAGLNVNAVRASDVHASIRVGPLAENGLRPLTYTWYRLEDQTTYVVLGHTELDPSQILDGAAQFDYLKGTAQPTAVTHANLREVREVVFAHHGQPLED